MRRIGIDVGGTFTDVVLLDEESGGTTWFKALTDYRDPAEGIMSAVIASGAPVGELSNVKLGTTLGLNAILTRQGARTGLITTAGFRDVLEIRRTHRDRLFDLDETVPEPLVPRHLRMEVRERIAADGSVICPLDPEEVRTAWRMLRARGVTAVAIVFLFSFENSDHEQLAKRVVLEEGGSDAVFASSDVLPVFREYERTSTTVTAAYVAPVVRGYVNELTQRLESLGLGHGRLAVMTNSGGSMAAEAAAAAPVPILLSGPAGGVAAARWLAAKAGLDDVLTLDMGGTSCDVSGIEHGIPDERLDMQVGGLDIAYPTFDIHTIGAGGGSIAWLDSGGALRVGPRSAGSMPGPACYGKGGTEPTVTDANLVLGRYSEKSLLGGSLALDVAAARHAIATRVAEPLGMTVERAAAGILRIVNALMVNAVRTISIERGRDPRRFSLVAFGGGGPVHAVDIARELAIPRVLIPPFPGCASAFGAAMALSRRDVLRSVARRVDEVDSPTLAILVEEMRRQAADALAEEGYSGTSLRLETWMSMHYAGQAHELVVSHGSDTVSAATFAEAVATFHAQHKLLYGHNFSDVPVELVTVRVTGFGVPEPLDLWWDFDKVTALGAMASRSVYFEDIDEFVETAICDRTEIESGDSITGPAVIHQVDATIVVPPRWIATGDFSGSLMITAVGRDSP